jgi:hypothetical protein
MKKYYLLILLTFDFLFASSIIEKKECQYWDDFFKKCRYEKTIFEVKGISCERKCQHWDKTFKKCRYETSCKYDKQNRLFIYKECQHWDKLFKKCKYEKEELIKEDNNNKTIIIIN